VIASKNSIARGPKPTAWARYEGLAGDHAVRGRSSPVLAALTPRTGWKDPRVGLDFEELAWRRTSIGEIGLRQLASHLHPGGVFAPRSNDPPGDACNAVLAEVFAESAARVVRFPDPLRHREAGDTIYVARRSPDAGVAAGH